MKHKKRRNVDSDIAGKKRHRRDSYSDSSSQESRMSSADTHRISKHDRIRDYDSEHYEPSGTKNKNTNRSLDKRASISKISRVDEARKEKELRKALETPEEKRARRLAKKIAKGRKEKEQMGWDEDYIGYTNADNPFGDEHLLDTFMWGKKLEKEGKKDMSKQEIEKIQKRKMLETKLELEKVKKRRVEREQEREEREKEQEMMQREKEADYFRAWEKQEDTFHLQQAKLRSKIRIDDGRAKPIDLLAHYISLEDDDYALEMHEPYKYLNGLTVTDLEDLLEDIKVYVELEQGKNVSFWRDITIITEDELSKLRKLDPESSAKYVVERRSGINSSVVDDVASVFRGKTLPQLQLLEQSIQEKLKGGEGIDIGYWETLLHQLKAHMARQQLRERHHEELQRKLFKLKQEQCIESAPLFPIIHPNQVKISASSSKEENVQKDDLFKVPAPVATSNRMDVVDHEEKEENEEDENDADDQCREEYAQSGYSPKLLSVADLPPDTYIYDPEEDMKKIEFARRQVFFTGQAQKDEEEDLVRRAKQGMNAEECQFSVEVATKQPLPVWSDKYRPRKPRFFNRVHTGFEWNKYNQTHYDIDNPPPKIVQGYKFNIFYPDLIDKTKPPQHFVTPCEDNIEFAILRFRAGPPYEDIAFKIVNKEWEYSYKRGFRCQFYNNIFQLWFHFKRYRYRR